MTQFERFPAFGSVAVVGVTDPEQLHVAREAVERIVADFDRSCSRFRAESELSILNDSPGVAVAVSPLLLEAVEAALRAAHLTDGDVDPTVGQALIALGYDRDFAEVTARDEPAKLPLISAVPGWRVVKLDRSAGTIYLPRGVKLDLGATAKALAADHAAAAAHATAGCGALVGLGGDFAVGGPPPQNGWRIRVTDDHRAGLDEPGQWISIRSGGLATSSVTTRWWGERHHLVDPTTGAPAAVVWRTVSVCGSSCLDANIASTAAIVRGEAAEAWLSSLELPSRLVTPDGLVRHVGGWPAEGDDLIVAEAA